MKIGLCTFKVKTNKQFIRLQKNDKILFSHFWGFLMPSISQKLTALVYMNLMSVYCLWPSVDGTTFTNVRDSSNLREITNSYWNRKNLMPVTEVEIWQTSIEYMHKLLGQCNIVICSILAKLIKKKKNMKWQTLPRITLKKSIIFLKFKKQKCCMCTWLFLVRQEFWMLPYYDIQ